MANVQVAGGHGVANMADAASSSRPVPDLPSHVRLRILALLPPVEIAVSGRLTCKDAAAFFCRTQRCTVKLNHPGNQLPAYIIAAPTWGPSPATACPVTAAAASWVKDSAQHALQQRTLKQRLLVLRGAAASGCGTNVVFAWQLLEQHTFPELLQSDHYLRILKHGNPDAEGPGPDVGSAAVASGLAHMLPFLEQRCPGLLDTGRTLEAAAGHCELERLQVAWSLMGQRLQRSWDGGEEQNSSRQLGFWRRMLAAAAGSSTADALKKMEWVVSIAPSPDAQSWVQAYGAAAASGDLARVEWLRERSGVLPTSPAVLNAVMESADLGFIRRVAAAGGYWPPANDINWRHHAFVAAAASSRVDSTAKLLWLAEQGTVLRCTRALSKAARHGNLGAVQLLMERRDGQAAPPDVLGAAVASGCVPTASFLHQSGCSLTEDLWPLACFAGNLAMVRWLLEAGCPRGHDHSLAHIVAAWPSDTTADGEGLVAAVQLAAEAGWPTSPSGDRYDHLMATADVMHPWVVWSGLLKLNLVDEPAYAIKAAARAGCVATLWGLGGLWSMGDSNIISCTWYADAAANGDRRVLGWLGKPRHKGVLSAAVAKGAPLCALRWLEEHGAPWDDNTEGPTFETLATAYPREDDRQEVAIWLEMLRLRASAARPGVEQSGPPGGAATAAAAGRIGLDAGMESLSPHGAGAAAAGEEETGTEAARLVPCAAAATAEARPGAEAGCLTPSAAAAATAAAEVVERGTEPGQFMLPDGAAATATAAAWVAGRDAGPGSITASAIVAQGRSMEAHRQGAPGVPAGAAGGWEPSYGLPTPPGCAATAAAGPSAGAQRVALPERERGPTLVGRERGGSRWPGEGGL